METIKNTVTIRNLNKFNKMSLSDFESNETKHRLELLDINYEYILGIKSGNLKKYTDKKDIESIHKLSRYFFGTIPLPLQKKLIKEYKQIALHQTSEKTLLTSRQEENLCTQFPLEYVRYLRARIYAEMNL